MSRETFVIVALSATCALLVAGRPQNREAAFSTMSLQDAANKTLCPIKVTTNTVEGRIPKHIKQIMCDEPAIQECPAKQPQENCCKHVDNTWRQCYQLEEFVPVKYIDNSITSFKAYVGCACVVQNGTKALEIDAPRVAGS